MDIQHLKKREAVGKGDFYFPCLCRTGTSGLWSSGRPTPEAVLGMVKRKTVHNPACRITDGGIFDYNLTYYRLIILCQLIPEFEFYSKIQIPNKKIHPFAF